MENVNLHSHIYMSTVALQMCIYSYMFAYKYLRYIYILTIAIHTIMQAFHKVLCSVNVPNIPLKLSISPELYAVDNTKENQ